MPKDWLRYKAEVHRLYIVEEKTVYQVREILKARYGFSASVRAYRMKFDDWGMRKYKSQKTRPDPAPSTQTPTQTPTQIQPHFPPSPTVADGDFKDLVPTSLLPLTYATMGDIQGEYVREPHPTKPSHLSHLDTTVDCSNPLRVLESIFLHWQSDAEFSDKLVPYFQDPYFNKWVTHDPCTERPAVFKLIEDCVPESDQFGLTKLLLEADLSSRHDANHVLTPWQESWYQVCDATGWDEAKDLLYDERILYSGTGIFPSVAEVVLAERLLESYAIRLNHWKERSLHELEIPAKNECTKRYREILRSFHHAKEDVCPRFYRYLLRFDLGDATQERQRVYENEYREKYILLSSSRPIKNYHEEEEEEGMDVSWYAGDANKFVPNGLPLTPPTPDESKFHQKVDFAPVMTTSRALEVLINKWETLSGFEAYIHSLFTQNKKVLSIFTTLLLATPENVFDAIASSKLAAEERISLTKAILITSSTVPDTVPRSTSWLFQWWCEMYPPLRKTTSSQITYTSFCESLVDSETLQIHLRQIVRTPEARKLFHDAAISLVGERLLENLKSGMRRGKRGWEEQRKRYMSIIQMFEQHGIWIDPNWTVCLFDSY